MVTQMNTPVNNYITWDSDGTWWFSDGRPESTEDVNLRRDKWMRLTLELRRFADWIQHRGSLAPEFAFVRTDNPDLIIGAIKKAEDDDDLIVRITESAGRLNRGSMLLWKPVIGLQETDLIEWNARTPAVSGLKTKRITLDWTATEIKTLKLKLGSER